MYNKSPYTVSVGDKIVRPGKTETATVSDMRSLDKLKRAGYISAFLVSDEQVSEKATRRRKSKNINNEEKGDVNA